MEVEEWKDIKGYEGLYQVSNLGRVRSIGYGKERILSSSNICHYGYIKVNLYKEGKKNTFKVHRLVAQAFIPNPNNLPEVNHKDENKLNNHVSNLEWCTTQYNINYGTHNARMSKSKNKPILCVETGVEYTSILEAEKLTGINKSSLSNCCRGIFKTAGGYHWRYVDK